MTCSDGDQLLGNNFHTVAYVKRANVFQINEELKLEMNCLTSRFAERCQLHFSVQHESIVCLSMVSIVRDAKVET